MLRGCVEELLEIAPKHEVTRETIALATAAERPWRRWCALAGVLFVLLGTLLHRAWAWRRPRSRGRAAGKTAAVSAAIVLLIGVVAQPAAAQDDDYAERAPLGQLSIRYPVDLENPMKSLPPPAERNKHPLEFGYFLMDLSALADKNFNAGNYAEAIKFYEVVVEVAPERPIGYSKLCRSYIALGEVEPALQRCRETLGAEGATTDDYARLVRLLIGKTKTGPLPQPDVEEINEIIAHLKEQPSAAAQELALELECELATRQSDEKRLASCSAALSETAPDKPSTITFRWGLALLQGDRAEAVRMVARAKEVEMTPEAIAKLEAGVAELQPFWRRALNEWRMVLAVLLGVFAVAVLVTTWRRVSRGNHPSGPHAGVPQS